MVADTPAFGSDPSVPEGIVDAVAFDVRGDVLAAHSHDGRFRRWRARDGARVPPSMVAKGAPVAASGSWHLAWGRRLLRSGNGHERLQRSWPKGRWRYRWAEGEDWLLGTGDTWVVRRDDDGERAGGVVWLVRARHAERVGPLVVPPGSALLACVPTRGGVLIRSLDQQLHLVTPTGREVLPWRILSPGDLVTCGASDGGLLAIGTEGGTVAVREGNGPWRRLGAVADRATSLAVSAQAGLVAVGGINRVSVASLSTGRVAWRVDGPVPAVAVRFDERDGTWTFGFADGRVARWGVGRDATWVVPPVVGSRSGWVGLDQDHAVAARGNRLVVWRLLDGRQVFETEFVPGMQHGSAVGGGVTGRAALRWPWLVLVVHRRVRTWNLATGSATERGAAVGMGAPVFGPDGRLALPICSGPSIPWLHPESGAEGTVSRGLGVEGMGCVPLAWSSEGLLVRDDGAALVIVPLGGPASRPEIGVAEVACAAWTSDGGIVFGGEFGDSHTVFHLAQSSGPPLPLYRHRGPVTAVAVSPNGRWIGSASADGSVIVMDQKERCLHRLLPPRYDSRAT